MNDTHTIIGMQGAGKTTYLAALWHLVNSNETPTGLVLDRLVGDANYLNEMVESWQKCEKVRRTSAAEDHPIVIYLKQRATGLSVALNFTDLSGEKFEHQFSGRYCSPEYVEEVNGSGGLLLFVNADRAHKAMTIKDAQGLLDGEDTKSEIEWLPQFVSEQAQLVDLLQCFQKAPFVQKKRRLALIVSAWDVVSNRATANDWLVQEMPFLAQYLSTNQNLLETKMWGISAQGGVLMTDAPRRDSGHGGQNRAVAPNAQQSNPLCLFGRDFVRHNAPSLLALRNRRWMRMSSTKPFLDMRTAIACCNPHFAPIATRKMCFFNCLI